MDCPNCSVWCRAYSLHSDCDPRFWKLYIFYNDLYDNGSHERYVILDNGGINERWRRL